MMSPLRKAKEMIMPVRHQVTKNHKELISNTLFLLKLCVFVPFHIVSRMVWLKMAFRIGLNDKERK
jgi:hypothetical protein